MKNNDFKIKSYINPSHGTCDPVGTILGARCFGLRRAGLKPCLAHSRIQNVHQTNARVRKCVCGANSSNRTLLDNYAPFSPVMSIRNVTKWCLFCPQKHGGTKNVTNGGSSGAA